MAIKFDITGDNQNFLSSMGQVQSEIQRTKQMAEKMDVFKSWTDSFDGVLKDFKNFGAGIEEQKAHLTKVIEGLSGTIALRLKEIGSLQNKLSDALKGGDTDLAGSLTKQINNNIVALGELNSEAEQYQRLLDMLRGSSDVKMPAVLLFDKDLEKAEELKTKIQELKEQAAAAYEAQNNQSGDKMLADAAKMEKELDVLTQKGIEAGMALGPELAAKAQYAQEGILRLTKEADELTKKTEELTQKAEDAWKTFVDEELKVRVQEEAGTPVDQIDTTALNEARENWEVIRKEADLHQAKLIQTNTELQSMEAITKDVTKQAERQDQQDKGGSLRERYRKAREEMERLIEEGKFLTPEFLEAAKGAKELHDKMKLSQQVMGALTDPRSTVGGVLDSLGLDAEKLMDSFSGISKAITATMVVQRAFASAGITSLKALTAANLKNIVVQKLQTSALLKSASAAIAGKLAHTGLAQGIGAATVAQKAFNAAILKNPIVRVISLVLALGAAVWSLFKIFGKSEEKENEFGLTVNETNKYLFEQSLAFERIENMAKNGAGSLGEYTKALNEYKSAAENVGVSGELVAGEIGSKEQIEEARALTKELAELSNQYDALAEHQKKVKDDLNKIGDSFKESNTNFLEYAELNGSGLFEDYDFDALQDDEDLRNKLAEAWGSLEQEAIMKGMREGWNLEQMKLEFSKRMGEVASSFSKIREEYLDEFGDDTNMERFAFNVQIKGADGTAGETMIDQFESRLDIYAAKIKELAKVTRELESYDFTKQAVLEFKALADGIASTDLQAKYLKGTFENMSDETFETQYDATEIIEGISKSIDLKEAIDNIPEEKKSEIQGLDTFKEAIEQGKSVREAIKAIPNTKSIKIFIDTIFGQAAMLQQIKEKSIVGMNDVINGLEKKLSVATDSSTKQELRTQIKDKKAQQRRNAVNVIKDKNATLEERQSAVKAYQDADGDTKSEEGKLILATKKQLEKEERDRKKAWDTSERKGGGGKTDDTAKRKAAQIAEDLKYQNELAKIEREGVYAREEATIAAMVDTFAKEQAERNLQHKKTLDDIKVKEDEVYKAIYEQRKKAYETANKGKYYENTAAGAAGWAGVRGTLTDEEKVYTDARLAVLEAQRDREMAEDYARRMQAYESATSQYLSVREKVERDLLENANAQNLAAQAMKDIEKAIATEKNKGVDADQKTLSLLERQYANAQDRLKIAKELAKYANFDENGLIAYYAQNGTREQKENAIRQQMERNMAVNSATGNIGAYLEARDRGERELRNLDFENKMIDWEVLFSDLGNLGEASLLNIRKELTELLKSTTDVEQAKELTAKLNEVTETLVNIQTPMSQFSLKINEHAVAVKRLQLAEEDLNNLREKAANLQTQRSFILGELGLWGVTATDSRGVYEYAETIKDDATRQAIRNLGDQLKDNEEATENNTKALKEGEGKVQNAQGDVTATNISKIADRYGFKKNANGKTYLENPQQFFGSLSSDAQNIKGTLAMLGIDNAKVGAAFDGVSASANAAAAFMSGDYVGAVMNAVSALGSFGQALGIGGGNAAEVLKKISNLQEKAEILTKSIDALKDEMSKSSTGTMKSIEYYEKIQEQQQKLNDNLLEQAELQGMYSHAHHSFNYNWEGFTAYELANSTLSKELQKKLLREGLFSLSAEETKELMSDSDLWSKIVETGEGGYGQRVAERLEAYAAQAGALEESTNTLYERLTSVSFESLYSEFRETVKDMSHTAQDFSDDFSKMMYEALANNEISQQFSDRINELWKEMGATLKSQGGDLSEAQIAEYRRRYTQMAEEGQEYMERIREMSGYDEASQNGSTRGFESMSRDDASELNGRFTAVQIASERTSNAVTIAIEQINGITVLATERNAILSDMRAQMVQTNSYLEDIAAYTKPLRNFESKMDRLIENTDRL